MIFHCAFVNKKHLLIEAAFCCGVAMIFYILLELDCESENMILGRFLSGFDDKLPKN